MIREPAPRPGRLYSAVTRHWPRIAAGLVLVLGLAELVLGGITANSGLELYLTAWAATTGGVWFLFEKAERALGEDARRAVVERLSGGGLRHTIDSIPTQFVVLFDSVFGRRHATVSCILRSCVASVVAVVIVTGLWVARNDPMVDLGVVASCATVQGGAAIVELWPATVANLASVGAAAEVVGARHVDVARLIFLGSTVLVLAALLNFVPDYLSLWETRIVLGRMSGGLATAKALVVDFVLTLLLSLGLVFAMTRVFFGYDLVPAPGMVHDRGHADMGDRWCASGEAGGTDARVGPDGRRSSVMIAPGTVTYPEGLGARTGAVLSELVRLEWRVGDVLVPAVPSYYRLQASDSLLLRDHWLASWMEPAGEGELRRRGWGLAGFPPGVFLYSAFFTSAWLWLYAAAALVSRLLLRMNSGVGFLLRATEVERQPFRSIGFVSVLIVSGLFLLGLPLVVL